MNDPEPTTILYAGRAWRPDLTYAVVLCIAALGTLAVAAPDGGLLAGLHDWRTAGFLLVFGLFTIATGFPHPVFGHVSFDRVAQVMSILVLGPADAALVNGLASFIYPWKRLRQGVSLPTVLTAALHNAGLMIFVVLGAGLLYQALGGSIPVGVLDARGAVLLAVLIVAMQFINDLGMMFLLYLRGVDPRRVFNRFTTMVEFVSATAGIMLAIAFAGDSMPVFVLQLSVLAAGMIVIMQYARMRYRLEKLVDERTEELRVQAQEFERQATHDKLTGLPNRRYADDYLEKQIELAHRTGQKGAVALADVDHFKRINDTYSHAVGDEVLERVARILRNGCRKSDFVARYGGEEFLLYFPYTGADKARQVCGQLREAVQTADWSDIAEDFSLTISFGLAEIEDGSRHRIILDEADVRLYRAKREGRNRVIAA